MVLFIKFLLNEKTPFFMVPTPDNQEAENRKKHGIPGENGSETRAVRSQSSPPRASVQQTLILFAKSRSQTGSGTFFISPGVGGAFCHPVKSKTRTANAVRVVFSLPCSYVVLRVTPEKLNHPLASRQAPVRFSRSSHAVPLVYRGVST